MFKAIKVEPCRESESRRHAMLFICLSIICSSRNFNDSIMCPMLLLDWVFTRPLALLNHFWAYLDTISQNVDNST